MDQLEFLKTVIQLLEHESIRYLIVGSYGSGFWGEPRSTYDIDLAVTLSAQDLPTILRIFPAGEYYVSARAAMDAIIARSQFNVIHPDSGNKIDFMTAGISDWSQSQMARGRRVEFAPAFQAWVAAPEDIILSKMLYYREGGSDKHLRDITGMLKVSGDIIDRAYIDTWARELEVLDIWHAILTRLGM